MGNASTPLSALVWWAIPGIALVGAIIYVVWVSKYQRKYENQTSRSIGKFKKFQDSLSSQSRANRPPISQSVIGLNSIDPNSLSQNKVKKD